MPIYELQLTNLGPFDEIDFQFDPQINVFVGPNNCGKSTVLMALGDLTVSRFSIPEKLFRSGETRFQLRKGSTLRKTKTYEGVFPISWPTDYWTDQRFKQFMRGWLEVGYRCLIPALRWSTDYRARSAKPPRRDSAKKEREQQLDLFSVEDTGTQPHFSEPHASLVRDEAVIQKIIDLDYRAYREKKPAIRKILRQIGAVASEITVGFPIEFVGVAEDKDGLYPEFKTPDGKVPINVLSQGTQSIIQWLGLFLIGYAEYYEFPDNLEDKPGVVIIDEIDAHMHPSWQRRILPALSRHFPSVQIFCSSHSPFVLAGLKAGQAQLLKRDDKGKVVVSRNQSDLVGWSMDEILRNFLDITNPTDLGTDEAIKRLHELRGRKRLTAKQKRELEQLRDTVNKNLLGGPVAGQIEQLAQIIQRPSSKTPSRKKATPRKKAKKASAARKQPARAKRKGV